jgi:hypothetical protein
MQEHMADRIFQDVLVHALHERAAEINPLQVMAAIPVESRRTASAAIVDLLRAELPSEALEITVDGGPVAGPAQLDSAILKLRQGSATERIVFLRIKDAMTESILPLIGFGLAALVTDPARAAVQTIPQMLKLLWDRLVVLKRENDGAALDAYETLAAATATARAGDGALPTTASLRARVPTTISPELLQSGLKRLAELKLIEVARWGAIPGDLTDPGNAWRVVL